MQTMFIECGMKKYSTRPRNEVCEPSGEHFVTWTCDVFFKTMLSLHTPKYRKAITLFLSVLDQKYLKIQW